MLRGDLFRLLTVNIKFNNNYSGSMLAFHSLKINRRIQMKSFIFVLLFFSLVILLTHSGCFPNVKVTMIKKEEIAKQAITKIESPSKAYLHDGSIVIFPYGFEVQDKQVIGQGEKFYFGKSPSVNTQVSLSLLQMPLSSIAAITYYEKEFSTGIADFTLGLFGAVMTPLSIYCISCPKCCFGSCPTIYTHDGLSYNFETELFSSSISKFLEKKDLDLLSQKIPENGFYQLRVTNEALETHYINQISLIVVEHPKGTQAYPSISNSFLVVRNLTKPDKAINSKNDDILKELLEADNSYYRSDISMVEKLKTGPKFDWIEIRKNIPNRISSAKMVIRYRNTLLSTILLYDVVLASQGIKAVDWIAKMNRNPRYAAQFGAVYKVFSGIKVQVLNNGEWSNHSVIPDAGPLAWKNIAAEIPVNNGEINIRLQFVPDNFMIDYVGFDIETEEENTISIANAYPSVIRDNSFKLKNEVSELIKKDDLRYLITNPGDSYRFTYIIPKKENCQQSIFVESKGYYTEWLRGSWIHNNQTGYKFNLYDINGMFSYLSDSWIMNKDLIEREFFRTKIPIKEVR